MLSKWFTFLDIQIVLSSSTDRDMGSRHRARADTIQVLKVKTLKASECRRPGVKQFHDAKIKFPNPAFVKNYNHPRITTRRPKKRLL